MQALRKPVYRCFVLWIALLGGLLFFAPLIDSGSLAAPARVLSPAPAYLQPVYTDNLAPGWSDWSWAEVDLQAASPVFAGSRSVAVWVDPWEGFYLHHAGLTTHGLTEVRFHIHGGAMGGQRLELHAVLEDGRFTPGVLVPPPAGGAWSEVRLPLHDLGAADTIITGLAWQDASGSTQTVFYLDDIFLAGAESADAPSLSLKKLSPRALSGSRPDLGVVQVEAEDPQGLADIKAIWLAAAGLPEPLAVLHDDGLSNDGQANDGLFGGVFALPAADLPQEYSLFAHAADQAGHATVLPLGAVVGLASLSPNIPSSLPFRPAWGSNSWSEDAAHDWQVQSGVPWDYVYQYITYEWYTDGWGGDFVGRFVRQAWAKGYIPMVVVYNMLGLPPACGEGASCYAAKLQDTSAVAGYFAALAEAARQASGSQPVIFNIEPDFYGFMQQYSNSAAKPAHIQPDDPASYPVALNLPGYANNLAGFGQRIVDIIRAHAPNALIAPMASMWATNQDPFNVTAAQAAELAARTAAFIDAMGGDRADLLVVEWSDRDAGSGLRPWWDDSDQVLPRPTRAFLWENALSLAAGKRLLLWQVPAGNMNLDNTCGHYQDNRAAYLFSHPRDWFAAGVLGVLFGGGATCMTSVESDGGFIASQGALAYAAPPTPQNLSVVSLTGASAQLGWDEVAVPDLWGYLVSFKPAAGVAIYTQNAGRRNSLQIFFPSAGEWHIWIQAFDAMGRLSPASIPIQVTAQQGAQRLFLPFIQFVD